MRFTGVEGIGRTAFIHAVALTMADSTVTIRAGFAESLPFRYGILGQSGFFEHYLVTLNNQPQSPYLDVLPRA